MLDALLRDIALSALARPALPEHRQIELYSKKIRLDVAKAPAIDPALMADLAPALAAFLALDAHVARSMPAGIPADSWGRYRHLASGDYTARIVGEVYRILRVLREVLVHDARAAAWRDDGIVAVEGIVGKEVMALHATPAGLRLLASAVAYYLDAATGPYPAIYVESMMACYYGDIVNEVRKFTDDRRSLYQFRAKCRLNRHFRFDCNNPKAALDDTSVTFDIGAFYADAGLYPIDFFLVLSGVLYIVPSEALLDRALPRADLDLWRARLAEGASLPASFADRFAYEPVIVNQPMS